MPKMSTDLEKHVLTGPTMGTTWSATFYGPADLNTAPLKAALQACVDEVDQQMSTWNPASDLMSFNRAAVGQWVAVPDRLFEVVEAGLAIGIASGGAFNIALGEVVAAWGYGGATVDSGAIRQTLGKASAPAQARIDLDRLGKRLCKRLPAALDLSGIAKGYAVDRMADVLAQNGIASALTSLDGELCARGLKPDGSAWSIAIERPDYYQRAAHSAMTLENAGIATSGDYRHWVEVSGKRHSHTIDPALSGPLRQSPASVTVVAQSAMEADGWATAFMILGPEAAAPIARTLGMSALFMYRNGVDFREERIGQLFFG